MVGRSGVITTESPKESRDLYEILLNRGIGCGFDPGMSKDKGIDFAPRKFILSSNADIALVRGDLKAMGHQEREPEKVLA